MQTKLQIFCHFPKTGGITLNHIINQEYGDNSVFHIMTNETLQKTINQINENLKNGQKIKLIKGHIGFGLHEFLPQACSYITMLRNPIDRMISRYYYLRELTPRSYRDEIILTNFAKDHTLEDFCREVWDNSMTRFISGFDFKALFDLGADNYSILKLQTAKIQGNIPNHEKSSVEMLEQAKKNLREYFTVIGLTEKFDESLILFNKKLGWENIYYTKRNVNKNKSPKEKISRSTLNCIEKYNELDIQLYKYAQELFEEQIEQYGDSFKKDLNSFKSLNPIYGKVNTLIDSAKTDFNQKVNSSKQLVKTLFGKN